MKCYKCTKKLQVLEVVLVESSTDPDHKNLCPLCASKFIETLSRWKDFDPYEELLHWNGER
jgi:DNA-directed RNA polymerase subunit RPC12/RpoP